MPKPFNEEECNIASQQLSENINNLLLEFGKRFSNEHYFVKAEVASLTFDDKLKFPTRHTVHIFKYDKDFFKNENPPLSFPEYP